MRAEGSAIVLIRVFVGFASCPDDFTGLVFRGDVAACAGVELGGSAVRWEEAGQAFEASFAAPLSLDQGLAWVGTWRLLP